VGAAHERLVKLCPPGGAVSIGLGLGLGLVIIDPGTHFVGRANLLRGIFLDSPTACHRRARNRREVCITIGGVTRADEPRCVIQLKVRPTHARHRADKQSGYPHPESQRIQEQE
jgi:hypothetical protein